MEWKLRIGMMLVSLGASGCLGSGSLDIACTNDAQEEEGTFDFLPLIGDKRQAKNELPLCPDSPTASPSSSPSQAPSIVPETESTPVPSPEPSPSPMASEVAPLEATAPLQITPSMKTLAPANSASFTAEGGTAPFVFTLVAGAGSITPETGLFTAPGSTGEATIRVTDAQGNSSDARVTITDVLILADVTLYPSQLPTFTPNGGVPPYTLSLDVDTVIDPATLSRAWGAGSEAVRVTDSIGNQANATVTYLPAILQHGAGTFTATYAKAMARDAKGNLYIVGNTSSPKFGTQIGTHGWQDLIVAKFDPSGRALWRRQFGAGVSKNVWGNGIRVDADANVLVAGYTDGASFGTQVGTHGYSDYVVAKLSAAGELIWARQGGNGIYTSTEAYDLAIDSTGNVFVGGQTDGATLGAQLGVHGYADAFLARFDNDGTLLWTKQKGAGAYTQIWAQSLHIDSSDHIYFAGYTTASQFGTQLGVHGIFDFLLIKFHPNATKSWEVTIGGGPLTQTYSPRVSTDSKGNIYLVGETDSTTLGAPVGALGVKQMAITKLSPSGGLLWNRLLGAGSLSSTYGQGVSIDASGDVYIAGCTSGTVGAQIGAHGSRDAVLAKLSSAGSLQWAKQFGADANSLTCAVSAGGSFPIDDAGNLYLTGYSSGAGIGFQTGTHGAYDLILVKTDSAGNLK